MVEEDLDGGEGLEDDEMQDSDGEKVGSNDEGQDYPIFNPAVEFVRDSFCYHALGCIAKRRLQYEEFVHKAYHVSTYASTHAPIFKAMLGYKQWEAKPYPKTLPPPYRKMPGRPSKKKRVKEPGEVQERQLVQRTKKQNRCSNCGGVWHNKSKCQNVTLPPQ
uniref:Uncharacterized protein n=1 Tax=Chenopodium quinoa TaxID=63459 RepID=A0A803N9D6_CHEQI